MPLLEVYSKPFPDLGYPRIKARLRLPGDFRSLATSFVGSRCLGILTCTHGSLTKFFTRVRLLDVSRSHPVVKDLLQALGSHRKPRRQPWAQLASIPRSANSSKPTRQATPLAPLARPHGYPSSHRPNPARLPTWRRSESNRRPSGCKPDALPVELRPLTET